MPQPNLIGLNEVVKLPGGILLAEGGMGKTTFMEQLKASLHGQSVHLFKLWEYVRNPGYFEDNLTASSRDEAQTLILDGLDEAPDLAGVILRRLPDLSKNTSVWISSRDGAAIRTRQESGTKLTSYNLAPLTIEDLHVLAKQAGVNGDEFLDAVVSQGLLPICAKPLGCKLALSVFRENGLTGVAQRDLWHKRIERLFDETPAGTRQLVSPQFPLNEVLHCSAWISLCLALTDNRFIWNREPSYCPDQSLGISDLTSDRFSIDLIQATLQRGVFSPLGDGRIMFSHAMYGDFLAAFGFKSFIPVKHWTPLFLNGQRDAVFPQREGIAVYLATIDPAVDPEDDLLGTVLRACWPVHLTSEELIAHLVKPKKSYYLGAYSCFLQYDLPPSLESSLDKDNAIVLLTWALNYMRGVHKYN